MTALTTGTEDETDWERNQKKKRHVESVAQDCIYIVTGGRARADPGFWKRGGGEKLAERRRRVASAEGLEVLPYKNNWILNALKWDFQASGGMIS